MISQYYDVIQGAANSLIPADIDRSDELGSALSAVRSILANKEEGVEVVQTEAKQLLVILLVLLDSEGTEAVKFLGDKSSMSIDLYVDNNMKVRKSGANLLLAPSDTEDSPIKSIRVKSSFENWNVNGAVKSDVISTTGGAVDITKLESPAEVLESLKSDSALYKLLKDDFHVTRKTGYFFVMPKESLNEHTAGWAAYSENGVTMVPARSLAANLDMDLAWDEATQSVVLTTEDGKHSISLAADSSKAVVDGGTEISLERPAVVEQGAFYVPLRNVAEAFGASIRWEPNATSILVTID
ncbi:hypothetical protein D3C75_703300 [compost metagenome]